MERNIDVNMESNDILFCRMNSTTHVDPEKFTSNFDNVRDSSQRLKLCFIISDLCFFSLL